MKLFLSLIFIFFSYNLCFATFYKVKIYLEKKEIYLGERVKFLIEISSNNNIKTVKLNLREQLKNYYISPPSIVKKNNHKVLYCFFIQFFRTGLIKLPPIKIKVNNYEVSSNEISITVNSNLKPNTAFKDIKPPETVSFYLTEKEKLAIITFLIFFILLLAFYLKLRKKIKTTEKKSLKYNFKLPFEEASENLIKCKHFLEQQKVKEFYYHLSYTLRRFIDRKFKLKTLEMTIDEIKKLSLDKDLLELLEKCDRIKFTGIIPKLEDAKSDLTLAEAIIKKMEYNQ